MAFIRKIKKGNAVYLAEVKNYREEGKVKQKVIRYIGKEEDGQVIRRIRTDDIEIESVKQYLNYKVLHDIALRLNLPDILGDRYKHILLLIYTQIVNRKSLYKIPEYIELTCLKELLNIDKIIDKHLYSALDELEELDFSEIEDKIFKKLSLERKEKIALVLDVTDTYFSGSQADWKSRKGKDGKYGKLIQIALAVTKEEGFPILWYMEVEALNERGSLYFSPGAYLLLYHLSLSLWFLVCIRFCIPCWYYFLSSYSSLFQERPLVPPLWQSGASSLPLPLLFP